jgi:hypothetical protein
VHVDVDYVVHQPWTISLTMLPTMDYSQQAARKAHSVGNTAQAATLLFGTKIPISMWPSNVTAFMIRLAPSHAGRKPGYQAGSSFNPILPSWKRESDY